MGSDDAYTIELTDGRILWLFGDTFIGDGKTTDRRQCHFIRNSIAIQTGTHPASAEISFHWRQAEDNPADFFTSVGCWLWPLHGALIDGRLILFFMKVRNPSGPSSTGIDEWIDSDSLSFFEVFGYTAFRIDNPADDPSLWRVEDIVGDEGEGEIILGAGVLVEEEWLHLWGWTNDRKGYLARCKSQDAAEGNLETLEWWAGPGRWGSEPDPGAVALEPAQTEFTIYRHRPSGLLCQLQATGLGPADLAIRWASSPDGPWSEIETFYRIPESEREGVIGYAGKMHPHLTGADLIATYASNGRTADMTLDDNSIYYPRFVKAALG